ncbi:MAG: 50S ribosomal protein L25/general stress protein Ctc [Flammeovirgaceae bacterium]|jgi:large subunit ribosomal protein L25|nr:50S ribosomal protein L25/general stress protein Ctc [Flammeovirgaceae bacterium]|tara:strand:+ start:5345 stop:5932 length:588 start_codon:yes stop_codon:yes gene_type:complete
MKTVEIIGYYRANLGKTESKRLRGESFVPCVMYGGKEQIHFSSPMILFRDLVYTPEACFVELNIEGDIKKAILQDIQFHPVSEVILHADFLELFDEKMVKMSIPIRTVGVAPGVQTGGKLVMKMPKINISALPANMPDFIEVDISALELGKTFKVGQLQAKNYDILTSPLVSICSIEVPRAMRGKGVGEEENEKK